MKILGIMSGTSLDGLDLAVCHFKESKNKTDYQIVSARTLPYSHAWRERFISAMNLSARDFQKLNADYGKFIGEQVVQFLDESNEKIDLISSHGHTIFHQPSEAFSTQIGSGAHISAITGITTICDFRSTDVALGGQGAPLVPVGDELLFSEYDACLNLGGIANISYKKNGRRIAFDICIANMALNFLAHRLNLSYDDEGAIARSGRIDDPLLKQLSSFPYFSQSGAKSIGREWFEEEFVPLLSNSTDTKILLATFTEHIAEQISAELNNNKLGSVLITGGGALNAYLIERITELSSSKLIVPEKKVIEFKEALIFAFLGYLRANGHINALSSVTGATRDSVSGAIYLGKV